MRFGGITQAFLSLQERVGTILVISTVAILGCAGQRAQAPTDETREAFHEHLVAASECRAAGVPLLSPSQMLSDITTLETLFARGYGGYDSMTPGRWEGTFQRLRDSVPSAASSAEFRELLADGLQEVDDNHVGVWSFDPARTFRSTSGHDRPFVGPALSRSGEAWLVGERVLGECHALGETVEPAPFWQDGTLTYRHVVFSREPITSLRCEGGPLALEELRLEYQRGPAFEQMDAPFPWLRLRSLMTTHAGALERFVESASAAGDAPVVVLDLRHTGGGSDRYLRRFFAAFAHEPLAYWHTRTLRSETMLQGTINFWLCVRAASSGRDAAGRAWLNERIERAQSEHQTALHQRGVFREVLEREMPVAPTRTEPFAGRLLVVVDRGCMSACESAVVLARSIPGALIVGENTGGVMKVGELRWYRLRASRVWVSLGHRSHRDPRDDFAEARGFVPDLWLAPGNTEGRIRELATCLGDEDCGRRLEGIW